MRPLDLLEPLAVQEVDVAPGLRHVEIFTVRGLLTLLWHGSADAADVVVCCGGAMGGLLGPAGGLFHDLGVAFAEQGIATVRVGYRRPNELDGCVLDVLAAADLCSRAGGRRFVTVGHSFGGAVAIGAGVTLVEAGTGTDDGDGLRGVVGLATQSAGCERAAGLGGRPLLLLHGERDDILAPFCSEVVRKLAGTGEVVLLPGTGHLLSEAADELRTRLQAWIPAVLGAT